MTDQTDATNDAQPGRSGQGSRQEEVQARARETADNVKNTAWKQAESQYQQQSGFVAEQAEKIASALRNMGEEFEHQDQRAFSGYAKTLAGYSDTLSDNLREKDLSQVMREAQDFGRRQPALVVGGAVATGFLLARFLRSSGQAGSSNSDSSRSSTPRLSAGNGTQSSTLEDNRSAY